MIKIKNHLFIAGFLFLLLSCNQSIVKKDFTLHIIETTDVHGQFFQYDLVNQKNSTGSLSQVFSYVEMLRNQDSTNVILLDNGDILQGNPVVYYGNFIAKDSIHPLAKMLNWMKYDAQTIGNHDIEAGHGVYDSYQNQLDFPLLAANAINAKTGECYFKPYTIIERQGVKIAILGLITPAIPNWLPESLWAGMYFEDMVVSAQKWMKIIQEKEQPDLVIGLFHAGLDATYGGANVDAPLNENACLLVAENVPGFDIVFSGHDHREAVFNIKNIDSADVLIMNAGAYASNLALADINFVWNKELNQYQKFFFGSIIPMDSIEPSEEFVNTFSPWFDSTQLYVSQSITELSKEIKAEESLLGSSPFIDLIHQAQLDLSGADISFAAPFSINAVLAKGNFTQADLFNLYRYENYLCTIKLSGSEIKKYLEFSTDLWFDTIANYRNNWLLLEPENESNKHQFVKLKNPYYNFDSAAGILYKISASNPRGSRVNILKMADGSIFEMDKIYTVVMNSYRANGGGGHLLKGVGLSKEELKSRMINCWKLDFRNMLGEWLSQQKKPFAPEVLNNWSIN